MFLPSTMLLQTTTLLSIEHDQAGNVSDHQIPPAPYTNTVWSANTASIPAYQMLGNTDRQINRLEPAHEQVIDHLARKSTCMLTRTSCCRTLIY